MWVRLPQAAHFGFVAERFRQHPLKMTIQGSTPCESTHLHPCAMLIGVKDAMPLLLFNALIATGMILGLLLKNHVVVAQRIEYLIANQAVQVRFLPATHFGPHSSADRASVFGTENESSILSGGTTYSISSTARAIGLHPKGSGFESLIEY